MNSLFYWWNEHVFFLSISLMIMKTYRLFTLQDNTELHSWPRLQCTYHSHSLIGRYRILITDKFLGILRPFLYAPSHCQPNILSKCTFVFESAPSLFTFCQFTFKTRFSTTRYSNSWMATDWLYEWHGIAPTFWLQLPIPIIETRIDNNLYEIFVTLL